MKLRQKLALVLATAMVATAVPVVTMAGNIKINSNRSVRDGSLVGYSEEDMILNEGTDDQTTVSALTLKTANNSTGICYLKIEAAGEVSEASGKVSSMIVDLTDGELNWLAYAAAKESTDGTFSQISDFDEITVYENDGKVYTEDGTEIADEKAEDAVKYEEILEYDNGNGGTAKIQLLGNKQIRVDFYGSWTDGTRTEDPDELILPLFFKAKATQVKVKVTGDDTLFNDEEYVIGVKNEDGKELSISVDDAKVGIPYDGGEISKLILSEELIGAIKASKNQQIKLELPSSSDLEWKKSGIKAEGKKAFAGKKAENLTAEYGESGRDKDTDKQILIITLPDWSDDTLKGVIELTGIKVEPVDDTAKLGELSITVSANDDDDFIKEKDIVVGVVNEYSVALTCDKPASVKAGRSAIVNKYDATVVLSEAVKDSLVTGRDIKFTLENGYIVGPADMSLSEKDGEKSPKSSAYKAAALKAVQELVADEKIKFEEDAKVINKDKEAIKEVQVNNLGQVIGFTIDGDKLESGTDNDKRIDDDQRDEIKMKLPVTAALQATGEVKLVANGRAFTELGEEDEISCKIADIISPVKVEMTAAELKVGLQDQQAGTLVISETDKGMFEKGTLIIDVNPEEEDGIKFQSVPKVEATNLTISDVALTTNKQYLLIEVSKTSTEAGKITISDMKFTTDRTVPEGKFPVRFYGDALTDEDIKTYSDEVWDKYVVNDFIKITTPNTEDMKNGALKAVTSSFTINSSAYKVDGVEYQMDAPAYLKDNRTMVPVRYLAYAFGLNTENVTFANSTATIIAGEKVIQVKLGSDVLYVNGSPIQMDAKAELVNGRAYVPMKFIAVALGVSSSWDSATQTATFSNVAAK